MRLNTNGHGNAINGRDITAELKEAADIVSVSLNESNSRDYQRICQCDLGEKGFDEMLDFCGKMQGAEYRSCVQRCGHDRRRFGREMPPHSGKSAHTSARAQYIPEP